VKEKPTFFRCNLFFCEFKQQEADVLFLLIKLLLINLQKKNQTFIKKK